MTDMDTDADVREVVPQTDVAPLGKAECGKKLLTAAEAGRWDEVLDLIKAGADVNVPNARGKTALWLAVHGGHEGVVEALLRSGAANTLDANRLTVLVTAAIAGRWSMVKMLARSKPLANVDIFSHRGETALLLAVKDGREDVVEALVEAGATNKADKDRCTPLVMAAEAGRWSTVALLVRTAGPENIDAVNRRLETALWLAVQNGLDDVVKALVEAGATNKADASGLTPLVAAAEAGRWSMVALLVRSAGPENIDAVSGTGKAVLWLAAAAGREDAVEALLQAGADVNKVDVDGNAPLSVASTAAIAQKLIVRGAARDAENERHETALWLAARHGREDVVDVLLANSADVNKKDENDTAALMVARTKAIADKLIKHGANIDAVNKRHETALWLAVKNGREDVVEALVQAGATNKADASGLTPLLIAVAAHRWSTVASLARSAGPENIDAISGTGATALWLAVKSGREDVIEALVRASATNKADASGMTPLLLAATGGRWPVAMTLLRSVRPENVDAVNWRGQTALWLAANSDREDVVRTLFFSGAMVDSAALSAACAGGHWKVVQMLARLCGDLRAGLSATVVQQAARAGQGEVVQQLIAAGAHVSAASVVSAAESGHWPIVKLLLAAGAPADEPNAHGQSALWLAARAGQADIVASLLSKRADPNKPDRAGVPPLLVARGAAIDALAKIANKATVERAITEGGERARRVHQLSSAAVQAPCNAWHAAVGVFKNLLLSGDVHVEVVRTLMRTQPLVDDSAALVADIEKRLKQTKREVVAEIGKQLLKPDRAVFACEWKLSSLLAAVLPRRDWKLLFLDKLAVEFEKFDKLPVECNVLKIKCATNQREVVELLDDIQRVLSSCAYDYGVVPIRKRNAAAAKIADESAKHPAY